MPAALTATEPRLMAAKRLMSRLEIRSKNEDANPNYRIHGLRFELQSGFGLRDSCFAVVVLSWLTLQFQGGMLA